MGCTASKAAAVGVGLAAVSAVSNTVYQVSTQDSTKRVRVQQISNLLYFLTVLAWPVLFYIICWWMQIDISTSRYMLIGLSWPLVLLGLRLWSIDHTNAKITDQQDYNNYQEIRSTGSLMFSAAFGVGILIGAINGAQNKDGSKLILLALMICAGFSSPRVSDRNQPLHGRQRRADLRVPRGHRHPAHGHRAFVLFVVRVAPVGGRGRR